MVNQHERPISHQLDLTRMRMEIYVDYFLSYINDFLTVEGFADYYQMEPHQAQRIITKGKALHQDQFGLH